MIAVVLLPSGLEMSPFARRISAVPCNTLRAEKLFAAVPGEEFEIIRFPAPTLVIAEPAPTNLPAKRTVPALLKSVSPASVVVPAMRRPVFVAPTLKTGALSVRLLMAAYVFVAPLLTEMRLVVLEEPNVFKEPTVTL